MYKFEASNAMIPAELRSWEILQTQTPIKNTRLYDNLSDRVFIKWVDVNDSTVQYYLVMDRIPEIS